MLHQKYRRQLILIKTNIPQLPYASRPNRVNGNLGDIRLKRLLPSAGETAAGETAASAEGGEAASAAPAGSACAVTC